MTVAIGRGVRLEVGTPGSPKTVTALTNADPGVATSTAHGLAEGSVGVLTSANGMESLVGMALVLGPVAANTFELANVDTTGLGTFTSGNFVPITSWKTVSKATDVNFGGGEADELDETVLLDLQRQLTPGYDGEQTVSISVRLETEYTNAMLDILKSARAKEYKTFRLTFKDGAKRVFRGIPTVPTEAISTGQIGTSTFTVPVEGYVVWGEAV